MQSTCPCRKEGVEEMKKGRKEGRMGIQEECAKRI
jgi:hypothetical protein